MADDEHLIELSEQPVTNANIYSKLDDGGDSPRATSSPVPKATSSSPAPKVGPVERTPEEKAELRAKLVKFYTKYNPSMLEGDYISSIIESKTPDSLLWRRLFEKYVHEDSDEDYEPHPQIVDPSKPRRVFRERKTRPKGGDTLASRFSDYTMALLIPVSVTMLIVVWAVSNFTPISEVSEQQPILLAYSEQSTDSEGEKLGGAVLNALIIVAFFILVTSLMVVLYKYRCMKIIAGWLILSSALILYFMGWIWFDLFCTKYQLPYDKVTAAVVMWNFGTVGVICIYFRGHPRMTQMYLVATSAIMAWFLTRLPEWTTWVLLAAVALYDVFAVLSPKGPLKALVEESQRRDEAIPGLVYESKSYKLGLGDFVFYSVLVGRAAVYNYITWTVCFLAVLTGLCATLCCLGVFKKALPALPISIGLGIAFNFSTRYLMMPYTMEYAPRGIYM
ncbi:Presenilin-B [Diplonema papillatum]|nr:Presenilin-B [Diplonema papillatum]